MVSGSSLLHGEDTLRPEPVRVRDRPDGPPFLLVSNRLPVTIVGEGSHAELKPSVGGLATALGPTHDHGDGLWVGWPGRLPVVRSHRAAVLERLRRARYVPVTLHTATVGGYYNGFSNSVLWPLLHYRPHLATLDRRWWEAYRRANAAFAATVERVAGEAPTVWIHDYHLMLLPALLRERLPGARIGFFLHTPFPSSELFRILPWRRELLAGVLGADLVGFHVYDYLRHFRQAAQRVLGVEIEADKILFEEREVALGVFPIGIDADRFYRGATSDPAVKAELAMLGREARGRRLLLGVDRMDYSKGIPERLEGYERFLERYPSQHGKVELLQVGVPSRSGVEEYQQVRRRVEGIVGRVNGRFATPDWTPVKYLYRPVSFPRLCALYRHAAVALVSPLRDGMNLVAKEYVAAQRDADGVLVLSEFAGAAAELTEALPINPYDPDSIAGALFRALTMSKRERRRRMAALAQRVWAGDVRHWAARFLAGLEHTATRRPVYPPRLVGDARAALVSAWRHATCRLLLLDYDGTLRPFAPRPEMARPDGELLGLLRRLTRTDGVEVAIVSGRDRTTLARWFRRLPLTLVAEHGRWIRDPSGPWDDLLDGRPPDWLGRVRSILEETAAATPGSLVEEKSASVAWHFRTANPELAALRERELVSRLRQLHVRPPLEVLPGDNVVEVRVAGVNKARVLLTVLAGKPATDFILAMGDDTTDEEMFAQLPLRAMSVHVGSRASRAQASLPDPAAARRLLAELIDERKAHS
jgi:trehalose 6-phosphate synthase/phosphatase